ncbi:hypothetical protein DM02DRAFT_536044 [Periconia macrospinosa]|uniref:Condensation domain-containing protein n=1 Tax=Periconia macrospinosa TaxID=97972 RepID=A0A2V1DFU9_9PLEO|nr:hypothetical protein DM02DRAFT_536044 [Periconia macrospinosa]
MLACNSDKEYRLVFRLYHAQYDGICIPMIVRTLISIYQQQSLPSVPGCSTYMPRIGNPHRRRLLKGSHVTDITSQLCQKVQGDADPRKIQVERVIGMPTPPTNLTIASLINVAWAKVLCQITGEQDVVYGNLVAGNGGIPSVTEIVGPCLNFVPVRVLVTSTRTSTGLVRSIQEQHVSLDESDSIDF